MEDVTKLDLYGLLEVSPSASEQDIKKAFRKKALSCHPDKNPDNPKAAELFHQLSRALEVLIDATARTAYDSVLKARKAAEIRNRELDSKRRKLKEDLEARERAANKVDTQNEVDAASKLQKEIERLRREGCKQVEEEQELLRRQVEEERQKFGEKYVEKQLPRLKVKWRADKNEDKDKSYTESKLLEIFSKYGEVMCVVMSTKRKGRALIEYSSYSAAELALQNEVGIVGNPLSISWVDGSSNVHHSHIQEKAPPCVPVNSTISSRDYESLVLMKLRQAEERKKLIEQMMKDDENK